MYKKGHVVAAGEHVALSGSSGNASFLSLQDQHLHVEVTTAAYADRGLAGRVSPYEIHGKYPLKAAVTQS